MNNEECNHYMFAENMESFFGIGPEVEVIGKCGSCGKRVYGIYETTYLEECD